MKAVAYYRTRPSEPEASDLALRLQREAVQRQVEAWDIDLIAECVEREGEAGSETYPAYAAAVRAASADDESNGALDEGLFGMCLIIATHGAIGTGEPFQEPRIQDENRGRGGFIPTPLCLQAPTVLASPEIALPPSASGPLCLHADYRPRQLDTLVYFCNAGADALADVSVAIDTIDLRQFHTSKPGERWAEPHHTSEQRWDAVLPGTCVWVNSLSHLSADMVSRYRVGFADAAGRRWTAEAHDHALGSCHPPQDPDQVWTTLGLLRPAAAP